MSTFSFPTRGLFKGSKTGTQPKGTSRDMNNVRPFFDGRDAGGQRPELDKWGAGVKIGAAEQPVVAMTTVAAAV